MCIVFFYRIFTLQDCGSWAGSLYKGYCLREYSGGVQVSWNPSGQTNPCQCLLPLTLMVLLSYGWNDATHHKTIPGGREDEGGYRKEE